MIIGGCDGTSRPFPYEARAENKFAGARHTTGLGGCPLLPDTLASFECSTEHTVVGGDHIILIGRVQRATYRDGEPLIFSAGQYCTHALLSAMG